MKAENRTIQNKFFCSVRMTRGKKEGCKHGRLCDLNVTVCEEKKRKENAKVVGKNPFELWFGTDVSYIIDVY